MVQKEEPEFVFASDVMSDLERKDNLRLVLLTGEKSAAPKITPYDR